MPNNAPARARDKNQNCFNLVDGRVETSQPGKRGSPNAETYCSAYCDRYTGSGLPEEIGHADTSTSRVSEPMVTNIFITASLQSSRISLGVIFGSSSRSITSDSPGTLI